MSKLRMTTKLERGDPMSLTLRICALVFSIPFFVVLSVAVAQQPPAASQDGPAPCRNKEGERVVVVGVDDKKATIARGEVLVVKLPARLGTGYSWHVAKDDNTHLKGDGEPKVEDMPDGEAAKAKVGGAQYQVFRFLPSEPGPYTLKMEYRRPFPTDTATPEVKTKTKTYALNVNVCKCRE